MKGFIRRLFKAAPEFCVVPAPDDSELKKDLREASEKHKTAATALKKANKDQVRDADYIREVLHGVLSRIEDRNRNNSPPAIESPPDGQDNSAPRRPHP